MFRTNYIDINIYNNLRYLLLHLTLLLEVVIRELTNCKFTLEQTYRKDQMNSVKIMIVDKVIKLYVFLHRKKNF